LESNHEIKNYLTIHKKTFTEVDLCALIVSILAGGFFVTPFIKIFNKNIYMLLGIALAPLTIFIFIELVRLISQFVCNLSQKKINQNTNNEESLTNNLCEI
jgi:hypothetical protein